jgi:hypothetical protein
LAGSGELPNGARVFNIDGPVQGQSNISSITTVNSASGGSIHESVESIKFNAPRYYQNQERAVTASDYETLLLANFPDIAGVSAYGGEEVDPPIYGKVFVAVDLLTADGVTESDSDRIYKFLKQRTPISIEPVIVNPDVLNIEAIVNARYNSNVTNLSEADIKALIQTEVSSYNNTFLNGFKKTLRSSKLVEQINNVHPSILGVDFEARPFIKFTPTLNVNYSTVIDFGFELTTKIVISQDDGITTPIPAIRSTNLTKDGKSVHIMDDGLGNVNLYTSVGINSVVVTNIGTVNYITGQVIIDNLLVQNYAAASGTHVHLYATPLIKDISSTRNKIIVIDDTDIEVQVTAETQ